MEAAPGFEPGIKALQASALPLGHAAGDFLERETRFELATLALARRCSTTELFPLICKIDFFIYHPVKYLSSHKYITISFSEIILLKHPLLVEVRLVIGILFQGPGDIFMGVLHVLHPVIHPAHEIQVLRVLGIGFQRLLGMGERLVEQFVLRGVELPEAVMHRRVFLIQLHRLQKICLGLLKIIIPPVRHTQAVMRVEGVFGFVNQLRVLKDRILVAGFSFAGGLLLKACTDPQINPVAIICYGSYYDLESALRYFLTGWARFGEISLNITPHEYARAVFFWNYLDQMGGDLDTERLRECMYRFITDEKDEARAMASSLGEGERAFANMAFDPDDKEGIVAAEQILPRVQGHLRSISPKYFCDRLSAPIFLIHGIQDIMIPYTETLALAAALERARKEHYVYISRIYSHSVAEGQSMGEYMKEVKTLIGFLNQLFRYL